MYRNQWKLDFDWNGDETKLYLGLIFREMKSYLESVFREMKSDLESVFREMWFYP